MIDMKFNEVLREVYRQDKIASRIANEVLAKESRIDILRRIVSRGQYERIEGTFIDGSTAAMLVQVWEALFRRGHNMTTFETMPMAKLVKMGWSLGVGDTDFRPDPRFASKVASRPVDSKGDFVRPIGEYVLQSKLHPQEYWGGGSTIANSRLVDEDNAEWLKGSQILDLCADFPAFEQRWYIVREDE